jgi:hypothetical protein
VAKRSLADRYADLDDRRARIVSASAQPTALHIQTVRVLGELLEMAQVFSSSNVPAPLRAMMRMLHKLEPELVKELANVPPEAIREFLHDLADKIMSIVNVEEPSSGDRAEVEPAGAASPAREDQPQTA